MQRIVFLLMLLTLIGCSKEPPNPEPELLDPIYQDMVKQKEDDEKFLGVSEKTLEITYQDWREAIPQTGEGKRKRGRLFQEQRKIRELKQKIKFLDLAILSRKIKVRREYRKAYMEGKDWPDPREHEIYKKRKEMQSVSRRWDDRVPTLDSRIEEYKARSVSSKK